MVGGYGHLRAAQDDVLVAHVRRLARRARRIASVCTGASVLAAAGLLDGRRATTHWAFADALARDHPAVTVDPDPIFIRDGRVATSAGVTSALDLTLSFVDEDHGPDLARRVARALVTYLQRPGTQAQMSMHVAAPAPANDVVRDVVDHVVAHLDGDLSAAVLAERAGVSERHLVRLFRTHLGRSPAEHVRRARTEAAAALLAATDLPWRGWPTGAASDHRRPCARHSSTSTAGRPRSTAALSASRRAPAVVGELRHNPQRRGGGHATAALLRRLSFSRCQSHLPSADVGQTKSHSGPLRVGPRRALSQERGRSVSLDTAR